MAFPKRCKWYDFVTYSQHIEQLHEITHRCKWYDFVTYSQHAWATFAKEKGVNVMFLQPIHNSLRRKSIMGGNNSSVD